MTDDSRIIWSFTENHLREWMEGLYEHYQSGEYCRFPNPAELTREQTDELYRRLGPMIDNSDGPLPAIQEFVWMLMEDMGLITINRSAG